MQKIFLVGNCHPFFLDTCAFTTPAAQVEQFGTAYELYLKMFENDNRNVRALYMAGMSMIKKGDKSKGAQICDKAIAMDPKLGDLRSQKSVL